MQICLRSILLLICIIVSMTCISADLNIDNEIEAFVLMEAETGTVLDAKNEHKRINAGYLTKLMSILVVAKRIESGDLSIDDELTASDKVSGTKGSVIWLQSGDKISVDELLKAVIIGNANDAMTVLAEAVSGDVDTFVMDMNAEAFDIGPFRVRAMESNHPGGSLVCRVDVREKSMVLATDFEHGEEASAALAEFSAGADLILYDGQYTSENYEKHRNFGHSTPEEGIKLLRQAGAGRLMIVHHDPGQTDNMLAAREKAAGQENVSFAREKETVIL